jgi:hypothetical protein
MRLPAPFVGRLESDLLTFTRLFFSTRAALVAENLFLRRQLPLFHERKSKPPKITRPTRLAMIFLARFFDWREALIVIQPETFSAGCTMNIGSKRRSLGDGRNFCGTQRSKAET